MNANQRRHRLHIAHHQGDSLFHVVCTVVLSVGNGLPTKTVNAEIAPAGAKIRGCDLLYFVYTHVFIIAAGRAARGFQHGGPWVARTLVESLASGAKVENGILLRRDGRAIASGGLKAPVLQCEQNFLIEFGTEALKHGLGKKSSGSFGWKRTPLNLLRTWWGEPLQLAG